MDPPSFNRNLVVMWGVDSPPNTLLMTDKAVITVNCKPGDAVLVDIWMGDNIHRVMNGYTVINPRPVNIVPKGFRLGDINKFNPIHTCDKVGLEDQYPHWPYVWADDTYDIGKIIAMYTDSTMDGPAPLCYSDTGAYVEFVKM